MRSPSKEARDPNRSGTAGVPHKRGAAAAPDGSPAKKQQKKPSKKDRRRVSFAPDPELTLVHEFIKDDDYSNNSGGHGRVLVTYADEEPTVAQPQAHRQQLLQQHPALVGTAPDAGGGAYRPGFWNKTMPENSPLSDMPPPQQQQQPLVPESPGMVSMELTQPTLPAQQQAAQAPHLPGEVTAGLPSLGALAEADELEEAEGAPAAWQQHAPRQQQLPLEVTAVLPSLGALAEADEMEEAEGPEAGWRNVAATAGNMTGNITAALPGLGALVDEDEEDSAGMDLTVPAGRVLEHHPQQEPAAAAAAAQPRVEQSPARTAVLTAAPSPAQQQQQAAPEAPVGADDLEPTAAVTVGRRSMGRISIGGPDEAALKEARAVQQNKWGFAPGQDDTLQFDGELHGRMIMGDQTFSRMYCDNTTGEGGYGRSGAADDTTNSSLLLADGHHGTAAVPEGMAASPAASSPALSQGAQPQQPGLSPAVSQGGQQAAGAEEAAVPAAAAAAAPNWTAPAFLPPYLQAPAASGAPSDHPALVQSPTVTSSSLNTLETRRVSVGMDVRRASINSRRFSMQDATGRLLADDDFAVSPAAGASGAAAAEAAAPASGAGAGLPHVLGPPSAGTRSRRRSSGAAFLGRDVTEKLLVDDDSLDGDVGPLADLKRQMRILSQGSPLVVPQPEAAGMAAAAQEVAQMEAAAAAEAAAAEHALQQAQQQQAAAGAAAKTPRTAVSMGYADSHNPATARLLRSGGTTRLLQDSLHADGDEEEDVLADDGPDEDPAAAVGAGRSMEEQLQLADAGGMTTRTNGTTKLLADMTMASVVGAKLLGRPGQGTPELGRDPSNDGLTDFSLDEFEPPPELPGPQAGGAAAAAAQEDEQWQVMAQAAQTQQQQYAFEYGQQQQQTQPEEYSSPALLPGSGEFGAGYPVSDLAGGDVIPGGPKLARTPITARPASQPRTAQGTPHSNVRSVRSQHQHQHHLQQQLYQHATPGTHGTHRLARTPGSVRPPAAAYPMEADAAGDNGMIPGGPKLARTPMGRTPATGGLYGAGAPGSAVAQHYPGSARAVYFAAGPGSASAQRYPGSAVAAHRAGGGGMTPQYAPQPMTFQDFARLTEVQFLDNLRRGASINYADLQPNPVPASLADAYRLLAIISPQVTTLENGIRILQEEVQARRVSAADAEQLVGQVNPAAFQKAATADDEGLEELRDHVGLLKKVCRQKAVYCLKDVRRQMEESRGGRLQRNLEALQGDLVLAQSCREQLEGVARAAEQYIAEQHRRMAHEDQALQEEADRRTAVAGMRRAIAEEASTNEQRRRRLAEVQERVAKLREEHLVLRSEREALRGRTDALQMTLMQSQGHGGGLGPESSPTGILRKLEELDALKRCVGWELESAAEDPVSGEAALRLAGLFRLRLSISRAGASASMEVLPEEDCKVPADRRALLAALAGCRKGAVAEVCLAEAGGATVAALVQAASARLSRLADLAGELDGVRLAFPTLTDVACSADGCVSLSFVNLDAEVKFSVTLRLPESYPLGPVQHQTKIWFGDEGQISEKRIAGAVASPAEAPGRLRAICQQLSQLAQEALPRPVLAQDGPAAAFRSQWQNPLFGSTPAVSTQT